MLVELTLAQEKAVVADKKLMLAAICVLSQWTLEQITACWVAQDFAQAHQSDQKLAPQHRKGYTLLLATRSWDFEGFEALRR